MRRRKDDRSFGSNALRWVAVCSTVAVLSGCEAASVASPTDVEANPSFASVKAQGLWKTRVAGGGSAHFPTGVIQSLRAHATEWADGSVTGQFSAHARVPSGQNELPFDFEWEFDVEIDCLATAGGQAWMGGLVTRIKKVDTPFPLSIDVGSTVIFVTKDRHADPSIPPGAFGPAGAFGTSDCRDMPSPPPLAPGAVINGGFTITQK